jgi:uncharacterized protein YaiL (DUF2058 family)
MQFRDALNTYTTTVEWFGQHGVPTQAALFQENYWKRLQRERFLREHQRAMRLAKELESTIKDIV